MALTVIPETPHPLATGLRTGAEGFFSAFTQKIEQERVRKDLQTISERLSNGTIEEGLGELLTPQGAQMGLQIQLQRILNPLQQSQKANIEANTEATRTQTGIAQQLAPEQIKALSARTGLTEAQIESTLSGTKIAEEAAPGLRAAVEARARQEPVGAQKFKTRTIRGDEAIQMGVPHGTIIKTNQTTNEISIIHTPQKPTIEQKKVALYDKLMAEGKTDEALKVLGIKGETIAEKEASLVAAGNPVYIDEIDKKTGTKMQRHVLTKELRRGPPTTTVTTNVNTKNLTEGQVQRFAAKKGLIEEANKTYDLWLKGYTGPVQGRITWLKNRIGGGTKNSAKFEAGVASLLETMYTKAGKQLSDKEIVKWQPTLPRLVDPDKTFDGKMEAMIENVSTYLSTEEELARIPNLDGSPNSTPARSIRAGGLAPEGHIITDSTGARQIKRNGKWQPL